jgi:hypothetical protein
VYWLFWLGLILIVVATFARGGVLGLCDSLVQRFSAQRPAQLKRGNP